MNNLQWLDNWYSLQCDENWEHEFGIDICTLDNPGWSIVIHITNTGLEDKTFKPVKIENDDNDWIHCSIEDLVFKGACGPLKLNELIQIFRDWVEKIEN